MTEVYLFIYFYYFNLYVDVLHWASLFFPLPALDAHPEWSVKRRKLADVGANRSGRPRFGGRYETG